MIEYSECEAALTIESITQNTVRASINQSSGSSHMEISTIYRSISVNPHVDQTTTGAQITQMYEHREVSKLNSTRLLRAENMLITS